MLFLQNVVGMKHKGSISQAYRLRNSTVIPRLFSKAKKLAEYPTTTQKLFEIAANLPVDRFYISDDAALEYVRNRYYRGVIKKFRNPYKAKLFEAFYDTFRKMMEEERYRHENISTVAILALTRPAPCIGMAPRKMHQRYLDYKNNHLKKSEK